MKKILTALTILLSTNLACKAETGYQNSEQNLKNKLEMHFCGTSDFMNKKLERKGANIRLENSLKEGNLEEVQNMLGLNHQASILEKEVICFYNTSEKRNFLNLANSQYFNHKIPNLYKFLVLKRPSLLKNLLPSIGCSTFSLIVSSLSIYYIYDKKRYNEKITDILKNKSHVGNDFKIESFVPGYVGCGLSLLSIIGSAYLANSGINKYEKEIFDFAKSEIKNEIADAWKQVVDYIEKIEIKE